MAMFHHRSFRGESLFRGFRQESPFNKGDLKYVILDLLKDKSRYGYEIIRALEEQSRGLYKPSPGVVYPTLQMLEEMGCASSTDQDGKKVYTITDEGRKLLSERSDLADEVKIHMRHHWNTANLSPFGEIMSEFARLGQTLGPHIRNTDPEKLKRISRAISSARQEIEKILED
jgi:DNA-binding PadR family transcriptional regulator